MNNMIDEYEIQKHLPILVYSYVKFTMGFQFILQIIVSMGHFEVDTNIKMCAFLHESICYVQIIGPSNHCKILQEW